MRVFAGNPFGLRLKPLGLVRRSSSSERAEHAAADATSGLQLAAHRMGADAVIEVHYTHVLGNGPFPHHTVIAWGTAVRLPWPEGHAEPELMLATDEGG